MLKHPLNFLIVLFVTSYCVSENSETRANRFENEKHREAGAAALITKQSLLAFDPKLKPEFLAFDMDPTTIPDSYENDNEADVIAVLDILKERAIKVSIFDTPRENPNAALLLYQKAGNLFQTGEFDLATLIATSDHREHDLEADAC